MSETKRECAAQPVVARVDAALQVVTDGEHQVNPRGQPRAPPADVGTGEGACSHAGQRPKEHTASQKRGSAQALRIRGVARRRAVFGSRADGFFRGRLRAGAGGDFWLGFRWVAAPWLGHELHTFAERERQNERDLTSQGTTFARSQLAFEGVTVSREHERQPIQPLHSLDAPVRAELGWCSARAHAGDPRELGTDHLLAVTLGRSLPVELEWQPGRLGLRAGTDDDEQHAENELLEATHRRKVIRGNEITSREDALYGFAQLASTEARSGDRGAFLNARPATSLASAVRPAAHKQSTRNASRSRASSDFG